MIPHRALRIAAQRERTLIDQVHVMPPPIGGWNARDSIDQMDEPDAILLDNWFPGFGKVSLRKGFQLHASGVGSGAVDTIAVYEGQSATKLLAMSPTAIYDATTPGVVGAALASGFTSGRWMTAMMNNQMALCNGLDAPQKFDGSTISALTLTGGTPTQLTGVNVFKSRSYFWSTIHSSFWYSAVNTLGGNLTEFQLGDVFPEGGKLIAMITWTRDGGSGTDDFAVFLMSAGYAVVYAGDNPGDASSWSLTGVFKTGAPLGPRAVTKIGGDAILATRDGYALLSRLVPGGAAPPGVTISDKIVNAVLAQAEATGDQFGWQTIFYPAGRMLLVNYPASSGHFEQHVVNVASGAWCRFKGIPARCFDVFRSELYFGAGGGSVYKALVGVSDGGVNIIAEARGAFTYMGKRSLRKRLAMVRPGMEGTGSVPISINVDVDFVNKTTFAPAISLGPETPPTAWGSPWGSPWATGADVRARWICRSALGYAFSPRMRIATNNQTVGWTATSMAWQSAGII